MLRSLRALHTVRALQAARGPRRGTGEAFYIVDTTLREGEQHATTEFSRQDRVYIAKLLDQLGVDYIELVNPFASAQVSEARGEHCRRKRFELSLLCVRLFLTLISDLCSVSPF